MVEHRDAPCAHAYLQHTPRSLAGKQNSLSLLLAVVHFLGTKPLTVSLAAQLVVLAVSLKTRDKAQLHQCVILFVALVFIIVSIGVRPPGPVSLKADILGTIAAVLFLDPAILALLKLRKKPQPDKQH